MTNEPSPSRSQLLVTLRAMFREEWRLHTSLFGGSRFALFPLMLALLATGGSVTLSLIRFTPEALTGCVVALAFMLGLQTGMLGFEGRDKLDDLFGGATVLLYSVRTLPLSKRAAVVAFVLKDIVYYSVLFILPIVVGVVGGYSGTRALMPDVVSTTGPAITLGFLVNLWVASTLMFLLGVVITLAIAGVLTQRRLVIVGSLLVLGGVGVVVAASGVLPATDTVAASALPPYPLSYFVLMSVCILAIGAVGVFQFSGQQSQKSRRAKNVYSLVRGCGRRGRRIGGLRMAILSKALVDVHRSSGGVLKLVVSSTMLVLTAAAVLEATQHWFALSIAPGITFGVLLSATTYPTYNWLMEADDPSEYRHYPIAASDLLLAKGGAFVLLELPVLLVYYLIVWTVFRPELLDLVAGGLLLVGLTSYLFGATTLFTGFRPTEFLFDTVSFLGYCGTSMIALIPPLMFGFFLSNAVTPTMAGISAGYALAAGLLGGLFLYGACRRWASEIVLAPAA